MHEESADESLVSMSLNETERSQLLQVMEKAKDFDASNLASPLPHFSSQDLEGQLFKFTNVMRGWQPRYFRLDPRQAVLSYYISEDKKLNPPRGFLHLWGAVISPSDEDAQTFSINGANSEVFRLKASDAKERQKWITHLRAAVTKVSTPHPSSPVHDSPPLITPSALTPSTSNDDHQLESSPLQRVPSKRTSLSRILRSTKNTINRPPPVHRVPSKQRGSPTLHRRAAVATGDGPHDSLLRVQQLQQDVARQLDVNHVSLGIEATDKNLLLLKATSLAMTHCLEECVSMLHHTRPLQSSLLPQQPTAATVEPTTPTDPLPSNNNHPSKAMDHQTPSNVQSLSSTNKQTAI